LAVLISNLGTDALNSVVSSAIPPERFFEFAARLPANVGHILNFRFAGNNSDEAERAGYSECDYVFFDSSSRGRLAWPEHVICQLTLHLFKVRRLSSAFAPANAWRDVFQRKGRKESLERKYYIQVTT
jgi:hypothetical protein